MDAMRKEEIINFAANILYFSGFLFLFEFLSRITNRDKVPILLYHSISSLDQKTPLLHHKVVSATPETFEMQISYLQRKYHIISLAEYISMVKSGLPVPKRCVVVTFDDGYQDNYTYAYPILKAHAAVAAIFICPELIDTQQPLWTNTLARSIYRSKLSSLNIEGLGSYDLATLDKKTDAVDKIINKIMALTHESKQETVAHILKELEVESHTARSEQEYLSWQQIRAMAKDGMSFGAHTLSHINLTKISSQDACGEITESKQRIAAKLDKPVEAFAYPFGGTDSFNRQIAAMVKDAGFLCACSTLFGRNISNQDLFQLKRIPVFYYHNINVFRAKVSGIFDYFTGAEKWLTTKLKKA
jgi:peptidoglycan/xylan/chitin deacetylase (PgdA/CDA1 family)